ncbi:hypothetical protein [Bdellovibrio svalbardensis]|uniref:DUF4105 domain-containing protein n=1 Tax=Bdellovibrio svalbardensis TaxID=2972972 RepID=A0ABT6DMB3_9BACT|nr:hypothetical protein [Bdellovibrio svalbardensis]MDG0816273.1 hypothetical protein [Bdellovibrio svalbardensis]
MSRSQTQIFDGISGLVFKKQPCLGSYAKVGFLNPQVGSLHIIYDSQAPWLLALIEKHFGKIPETLTYEQIHQVLRKVKRFLLIQKSLQHLGLNKTRVLGGVREHYYFDEPFALLSQINILLVLAAKVMFEKFTRIETRIVALESLETKALCWTLVMKVHDNRAVSCIFDAAFTLPRLHLEKFENGLLLGHFRLLEESVLVTPGQKEWTTQKKSLSIFGERGQELHFHVMGRTPAERRFENEEALIAAAQGSQLVPIEINFHPFWRPLGHTTLRIGRHLFELSATGWKAHNQGANTARAFIFNNPFFRKQLGLFSDQGMPPISIGVTLLVPKDKVEVLQVILENLAASQGAQKEKFSLLKNNCNQGIVRVLTQAGIEGFDHKGYLEFSTVLTYRQLLLDPQYPVEGLRIYPLPNTNFDEATLRSWIPALLYRNNTVSREVRRALPVFPRDFFFINWKRLMAQVQRLGGSHADL